LEFKIIFKNYQKTFIATVQEFTPQKKRKKEEEKLLFKF
jgi:hypothetical protein